MQHVVEAFEEGVPVKVILVGGPTHIAERDYHPDIVGGKIKLQHCGGHEHFERLSQSDPQEFRWTMRTALAE